ncbi:MAG TPA: TonB-dependent receptor [Steroidobacteraceae bacterium]|nr:TonB-dependent receptor [Steroidobacteraceae bacterium]
MNLSNAKWVRRSLLAALAVLGCAQAVAQELQEITVTAQRREEKLQDVPIAVSAFTSETLINRALNDVHALSNLTPSVNLDAGAPFSGDRSVLSASIRGIGQDDFAFNLNPGVGVYLDGVYLARTIGSNLSLLDVDRVEILKGPQGTLFGANTIGGAISIVTHTPGSEARFIGTATGGEYNRRDVGFTADIPITENVLSSISVSSQNQTGWVKVVPYPTSTPMGGSPFVVDPQTAYPKAGYATNDNYGGTGVTAFRGKILWNASDKLHITFTGDWTHQDQTALPYTILGVYSTNFNSIFATMYNLCISNNASSIAGAIQAAGGPPAFLPPSQNPFPGLCSQNRARVPGLSTGGAPLLGAGYVGGPAGPFNYANVAAGLPYSGSNAPRLWFDYNATNTGNLNTSYANGPDFARNDVFGGSVTGVYDLNDALTLKSITGYRQIRWDIGTDLDGTPETMQEVTDSQHQWQVSQEFQLVGKAWNNRLNYVGGLYYFKEAGYVHDYVPFESLLYVYDVANDVVNENYAAFVHADVKLTDRWGVTLGGRYTKVKTSFLGGQSDLNSFPLGSDLYPLITGEPYIRYFPDIPDSQSWDIFTPTVGLQFHLTPDFMVYASWGKGFKAGGWTTRLSATITDPKQAEYKPEYSKTYELGLKSEWLSHRLIANAALYYTDYSGIQLNIQQGISPVYTNAGDATIKGAELELQWLVGGGFSLNLAGDYIDAYYTSVNPNANIPQYANPDGSTVCPAGPPICSFQGPGSPLDAKLPKTPKYKGTIYPQWDIGLSNQAIVRLLASYTYTADMYNDSLNTPQLHRPATHQLDASIHYVSPGAMYDFAVGGTNLTDDRYVTAGSPNYGAGEVGGYYNPPRMWYATLRVNFGK